MKDHMYPALWWSMRIYAVGFAAFIAAFGAMRMQGRPAESSR
jgi:hypothetical protein